MPDNPHPLTDLETGWIARHRLTLARLYSRARELAEEEERESTAHCREMQAVDHRGEEEHETADEGISISTPRL